MLRKIVVGSLMGVTIICTASCHETVPIYNGKCAMLLPVARYIENVFEKCTEPRMRGNYIRVLENTDGGTVRFLTGNEVCKYGKMMTVEQEQRRTVSLVYEVVLEKNGNQKYKFTVRKEGGGLKIGGGSLKYLGNKWRVFIEVLVDIDKDEIMTFDAEDLILGRIKPHYFECE